MAAVALVLMLVLVLPLAVPFRVHFSSLSQGLPFPVQQKAEGGRRQASLFCYRVLEPENLTTNPLAVGYVGFGVFAGEHTLRVCVCVFVVAS